MKRILKLALIAACIMLGSFAYVQAASAAETPTKGWYTTASGVTYYYQNSKKVTGWQTIKGEDYYFEKSDRQNGLKKGQMYTGKVSIDGKYYYFGTDGAMRTGWTKINGKKYYLKKKGAEGVKGAAYTGWNTIGKYKYSFSKKGVLRTSRWIKSKYYVDAKGRMLTSCVTPDGYWVNANGVKQTYKGWKTLNGKKYYFKKGIAQTGWKKINNQYYYFKSTGVMKTGWLTKSGNKYYLDKSSGVMKTGWQTISGKKYYFDDNGVMQKNKTVEGIKLGSDGVAEISARVLLIAGHGQGDSGATSKISGTSYKESSLTRTFARKVKKYLESSDKNVSVDLYNTNYDLYQVNAGLKSGTHVTWTNYDYVLEIHFNATVEASKDLSGNGKIKGISIDVPKSLHSGTSYTVSKAIIKKVKNSTGFTVWSGASSTGLVKRNDLLNMRLCNNAGVSYGLLETCFIDDKDDMTFYNNNTNAMAKAAAQGLLTGLGL